MLPAVDWAAPGLRDWAAHGLAVERALRTTPSLAQALGAQPQAPLRFVPHTALPAGTPYERFIFDTGTCPVRDNLHDFFNALVWLRFPGSKRQLNRLQAEAIARDGIGGRRGPVRDAITVFDEFGALLDAPAQVFAALREHAWRRLFVDLRPLWARARLLVFGHALLEQLAVAPRKDLTAHVWHEPVAMDSIADADALLAARLAPEVLAGKPFLPLPVSGVPGWSRENTNFSFYDDSHVFRPRKTPQPR